MRVRDLEALRQHLGLDTLRLEGHSQGGFVAMKYALAYPERVDRLLVLNSGAFVRDLDAGLLTLSEAVRVVLARPFLSPGARCRT